MHGSYLGSGRSRDDEPRLTIDRIVFLCPAIGQLLKEAQRIRFASCHDLERFQKRARRFVGWGAADSRLAPSEAVELVDQELAAALKL